ncbi:polyketide biosynthesis protein [Thioclava sp. SK-1]|uniref:DsbA family oxidoreductase n=1 Tax=Thioclava sp. SK-1 TaxID=1889770 RepID=UPI0008252707|nr:DsbA family oxidoreductase [Thioclava sp. SK-1]OCX63192.1 polyketide biosynthesis protein [Thioclava sp. SK-1]
MTTLDIFADPVCPWCLIGWARLEKALAKRPDHPFQLAWQPFQLNPTLPREGMSRADYLQAKFGQDGAVKMMTQILEITQEEGIEFDPMSALHQPNTLDAHRLVHWAGLEECATPVMMALLRAHWVEARDIGDGKTLTDIAAQAGMSREAVQRLLATDADRDTVLQRDAHARERGITAVPTYVIGNLHAVSGAQPTQLWLDVIDELLAGPPKDTLH